MLFFHNKQMNPHYPSSIPRKSFAYGIIDNPLSSLRYTYHYYYITIIYKFVHKIKKNLQFIYFKIMNYVKICKEYLNL